MFLDVAKIKVDDYRVGVFSVSISGTRRGTNLTWKITGVYGPCDGNLRQDFFEEIRNIRSAWEGLWCLCEDFSEILDPYVGLEGEVCLGV